MLEKIKASLFKEYNAEEKKWVFLSWFTWSKDLLVSQWVCDTDLPLYQTLESIYQEHIEPVIKQLWYIVVDIVVELIELEDTNNIREMDPKEYGVIVVDQEDDKSWVILPNTEWIVDMKWALFAIKKQYWVHGKISIAVFRTERIIFSK